MNVLLTILTAFISSLFSNAITPNQTPLPTPPVIEITISPSISLTPSKTPKPTLKPTTKPKATPTNTASAPRAPTVCVENCGPSYTPTTEELYDLKAAKGSIKVILHPGPDICPDQNRVVEIQTLYPHMKIFNNNTSDMMYQTFQGNLTTVNNLAPGQYRVKIKYCNRETPGYNGQPGPGQTYITEINTP